MKTVAISIDEYIYKSDGKYYGDNIGYDIVKRYAFFFEKVHLISRVKVVTDGNLETHNLLLPFANVVFYDIPFFQGIGELARNLKIIKGNIRESLSGCDVGLVRSPSILGFLVLGQMKDRIPYAMEVVANPYEMYLQYSGKLKIQSLLMDVLLKHYCRKAEALAFVTKKSQQRRYELNKNKENNTYYSSIELKKDFFSEYDKSKDLTQGGTVLKLAHVANIITGDIKGHKEVLQVASKLKAQGKDVEIAFAGDGPDIPLYQEMADSLGLQGKAHFVGFINKPQLRSLLLDSDFFLFPSKSEGLPKVVIEAMAVSLPCIASNVGGIPELLPPESVFECTDVDGMAKRIYELAADREMFIANAELMYNTALEYEASVLNERRRQFYSHLNK